MTLSKTTLKNLAQLACLESDAEDQETLAEEVSAIIAFAEQLRSINTQGIAPLFHPMDLHQRFRTDEVTEADCLNQLAEIAPDFAQDYYLVPQVMDKQDV